MKKILSILGVIGLITSTTTLISCEKPNNNENGNNKLEPTPEPKKPQQPPKDSNWKLIDKKDYSNEIKNINNKWYIGIFPKMWNSGKPIIPYSIFKAINDGEDISIYGKFGNGFKTSNDNVYRWDGNGEPIELPNFDKNTGEITNWKG
ncbi:lipoprotein [Spiroplasma endosymbiont of Ammophila pubescens]|uniref:lipoprotein n=1 Tax=Spiroplasma endosymbiont of Ammophila pubescens TaxID=3066315 RepID=UPI0032B1B69D